MFLNDRSTRTVLAALAATAAAILGVNLLVRPEGLADSMGPTFALLLGIALVLWAWNWRESYFEAHPQAADEDEADEAAAALPTVSAAAPAAPAPEPAPVVVATPEPAPVVVAAPPAPAPEPAPVVVAAPPAPAPEPVAATAPAVPDDFTRIEGIGKYYNDALHKVGYDSFAALSAEKPDAILAKLLAGGFRRHPTIPTWPQQAGFAARGDWDGLKALQATLVSGRKAED